MERTESEGDGATDSERESKNRSPLIHTGGGVLEQRLTSRGAERRGSETIIPRNDRGKERNG